MKYRKLGIRGGLLVGNYIAPALIIPTDEPEYKYKYKYAGAFFFRARAISDG